MLFSTEAADAYAWLLKLAFLTPDNVAAFEQLAVLLSSGRIAVAVVNSLGIVAIYFLAARLWNHHAAIFAALLLVFDPFFAGLSGLLHVDALSATFGTISLLATAIHLSEKSTRDRGAWSLAWPALSGLAGSLAVLSKTPMLLLLPITGLAYLWQFAGDRNIPIRSRFGRLMLAAVTWGGTFMMTILLLFPAVWVSPANVLATVTGSANRHFDEALRETFFLGDAAFVHGPIFYPIVLLWRSSPVLWLTLGVAGVVWFARRRWKSGVRIQFSPKWLLLAWVIGFIVAITPAAKKFDRYILPAMPALLLLISVLWVEWQDHNSRLWRWAAPLLVTIHVAYWLAFAPFPLLAYNPLVGGLSTAVKILPVGWGEFIGVSGAYLGENTPSPAAAQAMAGIAPSLVPFFPGQTLVESYDDPGTADYLIFTLSGQQLDPSSFENRTQGLDLIHVERFGGLDQAWIFQNPSPAPTSVPPELDQWAYFGDQLALTAATVSLDDEVVDLQAQWRRLFSGGDDQRFTLRMAINDAEGNQWAALETDLLNEVYFFPGDWYQDDSGVVSYRMELPPGMPPGEYQVALSLIDHDGGGRLPVSVGDSGFQGVTFAAGNIDVPLPEEIVSVSRMQIPVERGDTWLDGRLRLIGNSILASEALAGSRIPIDLFWHLPMDSLPAELQIDWTLRPASGAESRRAATGALSRFDTGNWRTGESIHEKYWIPLPPDLPPGIYEVIVEPRLSDGMSAGAARSLAAIEINNIDRLYDLPGDVAVPMRVVWEPMTLHGFSPEVIAGQPGGAPEITLYWENHALHQEVVSAFVHVVDSNGQIVAQADHWPGGLPSDILDEGQVVIDRFSISLPAGLAPGFYQIRVGLYNADSGLRLPILRLEGIEEPGAADDYITLPIPLRVAEGDGS